MSNVSKLPNEVKVWLCELLKQDGVSALGDALIPYGEDGKMGGEIIVWFDKHELFETNACRELIGNIYGYFEDNGWIPDDSYNTIISTSDYRFKEDDFEDYPGIIEMSVQEAIRELSA